MLSPGDQFRQPLTARVISYDAMEGAYTWVEVYWSESDDDYVSPDSPRSGTANLFERNANATVPADYIADVRFRAIVDGSPTYEFSACLVDIPCECHDYEPPDVLCADISGCTRCPEINRRYRLVKNDPLGARGGAVGGPGEVVFVPGFPAVDIGDLVWWHAKCQVGCGVWHHVAVFRYRCDRCSYCVDDWFTADEGGEVVLAAWGYYPLALAYGTPGSMNPDCSAGLNFEVTVTTHRSYLGGELGSTCEGCATLEDYHAAAEADDSFTLTVFEDDGCEGCEGDGPGPGDNCCDDKECYTFQVVGSGAADGTYTLAKVGSIWLDDDGPGDFAAALAVTGEDCDGVEVSITDGGSNTATYSVEEWGCDGTTLSLVSGTGSVTWPANIGVTVCP